MCYFHLGHLMLNPYSIKVARFAQYFNFYYIIHCSWTNFSCITFVFLLHSILIVSLHLTITLNLLHLAYFCRYACLIKHAIQWLKIKAEKAL